MPKVAFGDNLNDICVIYLLKCVTDVDMLAWTIILARSSKIATNEVPGDLFQNFRIKKCGNYIMLNI